MFKTTKIHILLYQPVSSVECDYYVIVRTDLKELNSCLYGFKCELYDMLSLRFNLTIFRNSKKKWVYLKPEVEDFVYYVHTENKLRVYYEHVAGVIKKISKVKFEILKLRLPVKRKNKKCYENVNFLGVTPPPWGRIILFRLFLKFFDFF
jgi:ATP-dependent 26S proteasome regulatory subunit